MLLNYSERTSMQLYLVGCGKAKLDRPAYASELYTGSLFRAAKRHVEDRQKLVPASTQWRILSALHGLVEPDRVLEPYDVKVSHRGSSEVWLDAVMGELGPLVRRHPGLTVVFLAGSSYVEPIVHRLALERGQRVSRPLRRLELGERLRWFKEQRPTPFGRERAQAIYDARKGCPANYEHAMTPGEKAFVGIVWGELSGSSCWDSAFHCIRLGRIPETVKVEALNG